MSISEFWNAHIKLTSIDLAQESKVESPLAWGVVLNCTISLKVSVITLMITGSSYGLSW